jgi:hypothetical protein
MTRRFARMLVLFSLMDRLRIASSICGWDAPRGNRQADGPLVSQTVDCIDSGFGS